MSAKMRTFANMLVMARLPVSRAISLWAFSTGMSIRPTVDPELGPYLTDVSSKRSDLNGGA